MKKQVSKKTFEKKTEGPKKESTDTTEEDLPGYPHYPASEDIMNSSEEKLGLDIENPEAPLVKDTTGNAELVEDELGLKEGTSADVSNQDLANLGDDELAMDLGDDEDRKSTRLNSSHE